MATTAAINVSPRRCEKRRERIAGQGNPCAHIGVTLTLIIAPFCLIHRKIGSAERPWLSIRSSMDFVRSTTCSGDSLSQTLEGIS